MKLLIKYLTWWWWWLYPIMFNSGYGVSRDNIKVSKDIFWSTVKCVVHHVHNHFYFIFCFIVFKTAAISRWEWLAVQQSSRIFWNKGIKIILKKAKSSLRIMTWNSITGIIPICIVHPNVFGFWHILSWKRQSHF